MLSLTGHNYIGGERRAAGTVEHKSLDASSGEALPYTFIQATPEEVDAAAQAAAAAYPIYRNLSAVRRAEFLEAIADEYGLRVKGRGMMLGIETGSGEQASAICRRCFENGLIIETSGSFDEVVKVLAPLTIAKADLAAGLDIMEAAFGSVVGSLRAAAE